MPDLLSFSDGVMIFQVHLISSLSKSTQESGDTMPLLHKMPLFPYSNGDHVFIASIKPH